MVWDEAPPGAVAARFEYRTRQQVIPVENGCALAVFDDVPAEDGYLSVPRLAVWLLKKGSEDELPRHDPPPWLREKVIRAMRGR